MPTIRDLVGTLGQREGVEAAVLLGRDGLLIDSQAAPGGDVDGIAALVPSVVSAADELAAHSGHGGLITGILEYTGGLAVVSVLSAEAILLVLTRRDANPAPLLFELRRNREQIAALL